MYDKRVVQYELLLLCMIFLPALSGKLLTNSIRESSSRAGFMEISLKVAKESPSPSEEAVDSARVRDKPVMLLLSLSVDRQVSVLAILPLNLSFIFSSSPIFFHNCYIVPNSPSFYFSLLSLLSLTLSVSLPLSLSFVSLPSFRSVSSFGDSIITGVSGAVAVGVSVEVEFEVFSGVPENVLVRLLAEEEEGGGERTGALLLELLFTNGDETAEAIEDCMELWQ